MAALEPVIKLIKTCDAMPEQYNAMLADEQVGYLRLRHGEFSVRVRPGGEVSKGLWVVEEQWQDANGTYGPWFPSPGESYTTRAMAREVIAALRADPDGFRFRLARYQREKVDR